MGINWCRHAHLGRIFNAILMTRKDTWCCHDDKRRVFGSVMMTQDIMIIWAVIMTDEDTWCCHEKTWVYLLLVLIAWGGHLALPWWHWGSLWCCNMTREPTPPPKKIKKKKKMFCQLFWSLPNIQKYEHVDLTCTKRPKGANTLKKEVLFRINS